MRFASLSARPCLLIALGGAVLATGVSAGIEWWGLAHLRDVIASVRHGDVALAEAVGSLHDDVLQLRRYEKDVFINMQSADRRADYRSKWDQEVRRLRYDLMRTRALAPPSAADELQAIEDSVADYCSAFTHTCDLIRGGSVVTTQQANDQMVDAKGAAHRAEQQIIDFERHVQLRMAQFADPIAGARWVSLALNLVLLATIGGALAFAMRQQPRAIVLEH